MKISMTPERAGAALLALAKKKVSRKERTLTDPETKLVDLYAQHGRKSDDFTGPLLEAVELLLHEVECPLDYPAGYQAGYPIARVLVEKNATSLDPEHLLQMIAIAAQLSDKHYHYGREGGADFVKMLIRLGAPVNGVDSDEKPPLYFACRFGDPGIFAVLVEAGADTEVICKDILPVGDINETAPAPRCNLLKLTLDGKYLDSHFTWLYEPGISSAAFDSHGWDSIINSLLSQGMSFDPRHPVIAHHLQTACYMGQRDVIDIILRPGDAAYQASLVDIPMVQGLTLPAALGAAAMAGSPTIVEMLLSLGADPRTPFPAESILPEPFEWKRLFKRMAPSPLETSLRMFSYFPHFSRTSHRWDDIAKSLELMIIAGAKQPEYTIFKEECEKVPQCLITYNCLSSAEHLLDLGFRPLTTTQCSSSAALDLCVRRGLSVKWRTVLSHACHQGNTEVFRAIVKHAGPGLWKDYDDMMECARGVIDKPDLIRCFIDHCDLDIDYVGEQEAFREYPSSSLLSSAIVDIHQRKTTPTIQMLVSLGANTDMPGLPFDAKEALWKTTIQDPNWHGRPSIERFREYFLPAIRAVYGEELPYPPGWPHTQDMVPQREEVQPVTLSTDHPAFLTLKGYDSIMSKLLSSTTDVPEVQGYSNIKLPEIPSSTSERNAFRGADGEAYPFASLGGIPDGIRLLQIQPAKSPDAPLQSSFVRCSLAEAPSFHILTGSWGATEAVESIGIDAGYAAVSVELAAALRRVRSSSTPATLWSRALCINYQDIDEANKQMALIRDVHLRSQRLLIWLGEATDGANLVFDFLDKHVFELLDEHATKDFAATLKGVSWRSPETSPIKEYDGSTTTGYGQRREGLCYPGDVGAAYEELCLRPWFYMRWTETEVTLCDQMTFLCGPYEYASGPGGHKNIIRKMDAPYMPYKPLPKVTTPKDRPLPPSPGQRHLYDLSECRIRLKQCSLPVECAQRITSRLAWDPYARDDPRECIYATAALSTESPFVIDYRDSIAVLLRKVTEAALDSSLKILLQYGFSNKVVQGLPSWVPDLTHVEDMNVLFMPTTEYSWNSRTVRREAPRIEGDDLILHGFSLERIYAVGAVMRDPDRLVLRDWENIAASMPRTSVIDSIAQAFMHTLVASTTSSLSVNAGTFSRWYTTHGSGALRAADAEWFETCELAEAWFGPAYQRRRRNDKSIATREQDDLERYERGVWAMGRGRRFFVTDRGNMGLAPGGAAVGDVVMHPLTRGLEQPFSYVLTPREDGSYGFVGASCLYIADVTERCERKEVSPMDFVIR